MARYIDAVELLKAIGENQRNTEHHKDGRAKQIHVNEHRHFTKMIYDQPTADVIPKAKVEEMLQQIDTLIIEYLDGFYTTVKFIELFNELKKKYTEDKNE